MPSINIDQYYQLHQMIHSLDNIEEILNEILKLTGGYFQNLIQLGDLSITLADDITNSIESQQNVQHLIDYLNTTHSKVIQATFYKFYKSGETLALQDIYNSNRQVWALLVINDIKLSETQQLPLLFDYTIRMNFTTIPTTSFFSNYYNLGYDHTFQLYGYSGFISLQMMLSDYALAAAAAA